MGLDLVEFVMDVEETFDISIPNGDAAAIATPGELVDYLLKRLPPGATTACLTQRAFYLVRDAVVRVLGHPPAAILPDTCWDELIRPSSRRETWNLLGIAAGAAEWPSITMRGAFPKGLFTVGESARSLVERAPTALREPGSGWTRREVEEVVRSLMKRQFAIDEFCWDQRFVQDLGLD